MSNDRSRQKLLDFLDYLGDKGLIASATISSRKAAANKVLGILPDEEAIDVTVLDLDDVMARFQRLEGKNYKPASLNVYLSRLRSSIDDFKSYLENPLGFRPNSSTRERRVKTDTNNKNSIPQGKSTRSHVSDDLQQWSTPPMPSNSILPIPIRQGITVYVQGIPFDLTESEAAKIANVIKAMAMPA